MPKTSSTFKEYANLPKYDADLYSDLSDLGWDYTAGRMSRSGMEVYDTIMTRLGFSKRANTGMKIAIKTTDATTRSHSYILNLPRRLRGRRGYLHAHVDP